MLAKLHCTWVLLMIYHIAFDLGAHPALSSKHASFYVPLMDVMPRNHLGAVTLGFAGCAVSHTLQGIGKGARRQASSDIREGSA